jgi:hypothetical protein
MPNKTLFLIGAGVGLVLILGAAWAARRALPALNPLNPENIVNQGVTGLVTELAGRPETLGGWLAELFDPATRAANEMLRTPPIAGWGARPADELRIQPWSPTDNTRYSFDVFL